MRISLRFALPILLVAAGCDDTAKFSGDASDDTSVDTSVDTAADVPFDPGPDTAHDTTIDVPSDGPTDVPADTVHDTSTDVPTDTGPDMRDSDGDTIRDVDEGDGTVDTDGDGTPDSEDTDSDGDTISDADEAGDADLLTPPDDCDDDGTPSFRDADSDDDGLADELEASVGTDPCSADTDGDGTSDLAEVAYGSDPLDSEDNPTSYGDFVFLVPHGGPPSPTTDTLVFSTELKVADVYFLVDQTCSLMEEISALVGSLSSTITGIQGAIPDAWFGVGAFQDCGGGSYACPNEMANLQSMTSDAAAVDAALAPLAEDCCGGSEPYYHSLYALATGDLAPFAAWNVHPTSWTCPPGAVGWPCFRPHAVPIIVQLGDEDLDSAGSYCTPSMTDTNAVNALNAIDARYIGLNAGDSHEDMVRVATGTGSVDSSGTPLVFDVAGGAGIGTQVVDAVSLLATSVPIRVDAVIHDDPSDFVNAVTAFVQSIHTNTSGSSIWDPILGETRICTSGIPVSAGGTPPTTDHFDVVEPGQSVCFDIVPRTNTSVTATTVPLVFHATIEVIGDLHTPLDERDVVFVVPPVIPGG